ncbi:peptidylprolyl isomerase [Marinicauda salina]|jgi:peptidyl-prolyl cis-trans isomerase A (cyclophilin A)|uniref:peptidylprolyl isomerase n=1 Tax=Marinicauda salina TaxID=2135793 RepID=A0A2U2BWX3_9PROT|nr:peptidylprolyl isomerase [Marinicauda salina]PWE18521.1 peptidylprolyl isomerase [Marinicauda salina]
MPDVIIRTALGDIEVELEFDKAPITSRNFLRNIDEGLFRGGSFYRSAHKDDATGANLSIIQGGANKDLDQPKPIEHETTATTGLRHGAGAVSMARMERGTATTEFFICLEDTPGLDFREATDAGAGYAVFGRVVGGMDVVRAIHDRETGDPDLSASDAGGIPEWLRPQLLNDPILIHEMVVARRG